MGATIWIELQGRPVMETANDSGKMLRLSDQLDAVATRIGVTRLSAFFDYSPMAEGDDEEDYENDGGEGDDESTVQVHDSLTEQAETTEESREWFDSIDGLKTIQAVREYLAEHRDAVQLPTHSAADFARYHRELLDELLLCERFLAEAIASGQMFRLLIVP